MQELNLRLGQAVALTYAQTDENFKRLKTAIDSLEIAVAGAGLGTVTSVGLTLPSIFTVTNSPVTTTGSLTATLASQAANRVFASPSGTSGTPTFRILDNADLPVVSIAKGGTGSSVTATANQVIASTGSVYEGRTISGSAGLTISQGPGLIQFTVVPGDININDLLGVLLASKGGTGISAAPAYGSLLIGNGLAWANTTLSAGVGISIVNGPGTIEIKTSGVITQAGGIGNYVTKFSLFSSDTITNSTMFDTGARVGLNTITPSYELDVFPLTGGGADSTLRVKTNTVGFRANLRLEDGGNTTTLSSLGIFNSNATIITNIGWKVYPSGNVQAVKGFAIDGFTYWNTASNYVFPSNEQYGVILGPTSPNTMNVTLPTTPMDGQEICILTEEAKILTLIATGSTIFGHNAGVNVDIQIIGGGAGAASVLVKYAAAANGGLGAWFITGL